MTDKVQKIREEIEKLHGNPYYMMAVKDALAIIDSLQEEPVSEDLEKAARSYSNSIDNICGGIGEQTRNAFKAGAEWQKSNLWKPADGDDLPEIDKEVVAFQEIFPTDVDVPSLLKIVIAHRPDPKGWDGKSLRTGKVEHYTAETYGKGGWNLPNIQYWLNLDFPMKEGGEE